MQRTVREILDEGTPSFSFEFFPPQTDEGETHLWQTIRELEPLEPSFVDVTYGAGGSNRDRTLRIVRRIAAETDLTVVAHLTCVGATRDELKSVIADFADAGIRNVLAIRGDMPGGFDVPWEAVDGGLEHADELVSLLHEEGDFCVGVAAHPLKHPEAPDLETDVAYLAGKCDAGADFAITQFFFEVADYARLVDTLRVTCEMPVLPGIMPVTNVRQVQRMAGMMGTEFPPDLAERLNVVADDAEAVRAIGVDFAVGLCRDLLAAGAPGIHFYTLNRSTATREIYARFDGARV